MQDASSLSTEATTQAQATAATAATAAAIIGGLAHTCRIATPHDAVLNSECAYTFHSPYTTDKGILVSLSTFIGSVESLAPSDALYVRIVKKRIVKQQQEAKNNDNDDKASQEKEATATTTVTKLGVGIEGGFAREDAMYDTLTTYSVVCKTKSSSDDKNSDNVQLIEVPYDPSSDDDKSNLPEIVIKSVESIIHHAGLAVQQDVSAWELDQEGEKPVSKYAANLIFQDNGKTISPDPSKWKCEKSGDTENLWLNLSDGYIGGGRKNWDGSGGSNGALDHFQETGERYPLVVKLGTITKDVDTADCYSYAKDEDGPVKIPNLADLLEKRGIHIAGMQKTVKSTAELEVELNATYAFDAITEAGAHLVPVTGPGFQGLQNLGNSCYINSVAQLLLSGTVPELSHRYGVTVASAAAAAAATGKSSENNNDVAAAALVTTHPLLQGVSPKEAVSDLLLQTAKLSCALTSGVFAGPAPESAVVTDAASSTTTDLKYRLQPRMFKHVVGSDHVDFRTGQQQDAAQFLQYFLEKLDRAELGGGTNRLTRSKISSSSGSSGTAMNDIHDDSASSPPPLLASTLFSYQTTDRLVCSADGLVKYKDSAPETILSLRVPMDKATIVVEDSKMDESGDGDDNNNNNNNDSNNNNNESPDAAPAEKKHKSEDDSNNSDKKEEDEKKVVPTVSLQSCLDSWAAPTTVDDYRWPHLGNTNNVQPATQQTRLTNFPRYLIVQIQRYTLGADWTPQKLEVNIDVGDPESVLDLNEFKSTGPQEGEQLVPDDENENEGKSGNNNINSNSNDGDASPAAAKVQIDEGALGQLMDMGFSMNGCQRALMAVGGSNVEAAMNWVFEHNMDPDFNDPIPEGGGGTSSSSKGDDSAGGSGSSSGVNESDVATLVANLGCFTSDQVRAALKETGGSPDRAAEWLFSHMDDLDGAIAALNSKNEAASFSSSPSSKKKVTLEDGDGKYKLVGMVSHIGKNTGSGHYVAHLKRQKNDDDSDNDPSNNGKWVIFNDEKVAWSEHAPFPHAYLYLYQRVDTIDAPNPNY